MSVTKASSRLRWLFFGPCNGRISQKRGNNSSFRQTASINLDDVSRKFGLAAASAKKIRQNVHVEHSVCLSTWIFSVFRRKATHWRQSNCNVLSPAPSGCTQFGRMSSYFVYRAYLFTTYKWHMYRHTLGTDATDGRTTHSRLAMRHRQQEKCLSAGLFRVANINHTHTLIGGPVNSAFREHSVHLSGMGGGKRALPCIRCSTFTCTVSR